MTKPSRDRLKRRAYLDTQGWPAEAVAGMLRWPSRAAVDELEQLLCEGKWGRIIKAYKECFPDAKIEEIR